jgi:peptide/nickel transport system permease protein
MQTFLIRRLIAGIVVIVLVSFLVFSLSRLAGDPRLLYTDGYTTADSFEELGKQLGLDKPFVVQYVLWMSGAVRGDFGVSLYARTSAINVIKERIPATLELSAGALVFALITGIPLGVMSAVKRGTIWDYVGRTFALFGQALPAFWLGIMLVLIFSVQLDLLPTSRRGDWSHYVLPSVTLGWVASAGFLRLVRSAMLEILDSEYVKFARAKGVNHQKVIWKHALRNALIPPLTYAGVLMGAFLTGAVVIETVFGWPGLGSLAVKAVLNNDFPVMTGVVMIFAAIYVAANFMVDILYAYIDPRIRYS